MSTLAEKTKTPQKRKKTTTYWKPKEYQNVS